MTNLQEHYARDGFCLLPDNAIADELVQRAQEGLVAVRDGHFDTGIEEYNLRIDRWICPEGYAPIS